MSTGASDSHESASSGPARCSYTYGVGSVVDLPNLSVMVMGLDDWNHSTTGRRSTEERLLTPSSTHLGRQVARSRSPATCRETDTGLANPFERAA